MNFEVGQVFSPDYPPEAAIWCNAREDCYIEEIETGQDGQRRFQIVKIPDPTPEQIAEQQLQAAKQQRAQAVSAIKVQVDGMTFDGDQIAQARLGRTIAAAVALGVDLNTTKQVWVLADNTVAEPTIAQLTKALQLAGEQQTKLWTVPYEQDSDATTQTLGLLKGGL